MITTVGIIRPVVERLMEVNTNQRGKLYGAMYDETLLIMGIIVDIPSNKTYPELGNENAEHMLPAGLYWCGLYQIYSTKNNSVDISIGKLKEVSVTGNSVYISKIVGESNFTSQALINERLSDIQYFTMNEEEVSNRFIHLRVMSTLTVPFDTESTPLISILKLLKDKILNDGGMFNFSKSNYFLHPSTLNTIPSTLVFANLCNVEENSIEIKNAMIQGPAEVNVAFSITNDTNKRKTPAIKLSIGKFTKGIMRLPIDVICMAQKNCLVRDSYDLLMESLSRWFDLLLYHYEDYPINKKLEEITVCHFFPMPLHHYVSFIIDAESNDEILAEKRKLLHEKFSLPLNRPQFRKNNALEFGKKETLLNVHCGLRLSRVPNGRISIVRGNYGYYHYMLKSFSDKGWGCAYRSFQTIFSWFRFQGYTAEEIPTHLEIQKCLVKLGDKPTSFLGTNSWIGSTEISFCLDEMLGVGSVILNVSSGEELGTLGSQLEYHFRTAGTPVMIGGGCLAHTILGVDFNEETGALKFLILDPHYISSSSKENLKQIQTEGGVFWKSCEFWPKNNFYNLCLPQPLSSY